MELVSWQVAWVAHLDFDHDASDAQHQYQCSHNYE
jgi:hypothetical protein